MHPQITKFTPFSYFTEKLRKHYWSMSDLIFFFFLFPFTNFKWNMLTQGFRNVTEALQKPSEPFFKKLGEVLAAQLAQASWLLTQEDSWCIPLLLSSPPFSIFVFFVVFFLKRHRTRDAGVKLSEVIDWGLCANKQLFSWQKLGLGSLFTPPPLC